MDDVELTDMRAEHPEWLLGSDQTSEWFALSWNMAVAEVREQRLAHVREMLRYDWDGIELDWQRHAHHLPVKEACEHQTPPSDSPLHRTPPQEFHPI